MNRTAIVDYGVGNLFSLSCSLRWLGADAVITADPEELRSAARIILPGVGAFGDAAEKLAATGLIPVLEEQAAAGKPLLGICLGMQLLLEKSYEFGEYKGLGFIPGSVRPLDEALEKTGTPLKIPHMGWNALRILRPDCPILKNTPPETHVYFVHSFYGTDCDENVAADAEYGVRVPAVVWRDNVYGCQFHPEKSGEAGLRLLRAFTELGETT